MPVRLLRELAHMAAGSPLISRTELASGPVSRDAPDGSVPAAALPVTLDQLAEHLDAPADTVRVPLPGRARVAVVFAPAVAEDWCRQADNGGVS